ncbi:MAG TPA: Fe-Mn family superoxide dismutase [Candidatus Moranbacteria bacterium]|nr:Fe-Mn family superoxide dismutase [Candidatus Moranbacteria bacterium]HRZ33645.1 Fe-Mn family superoxide dismutase [Candidatus Moranbacteria bacterium]
MYETKNFEKLLGIEGFSEKLLKNHFTLYQGYVNNFNKLDEILMGMEKEGKFEGPVFSELNRRLGWEFDGMRLHELYFENMMKGGSKMELDSDLGKKIKQEWESFAMWEKDFKSMGAMRGIGWVILYYDKIAGRLFNVWINEHDSGHLVGCVPILVMDVFEHAYIGDYEIKKADYIEAFMKVVCWHVVTARFNEAKKSVK